MSKELETLKHLIYTGNTQEHSEVLYEIDIDKCFDTIEQALITKSKKELAFDIIKEKCVDVGYVITLFMYKDYNSKMDELWGNEAVSYYLIEQEFDLLKEVLE